MTRRNKRFCKNTGFLVFQYRKERGMSQAELAKAIGLSRCSVVNMEAGRQNINIFTLARIADTLFIPVGRFIPELNP